MYIWESDPNIYERSTGFKAMLRQRAILLRKAVEAVTIQM